MKMIVGTIATTAMLGLMLAPAFGTTLNVGNGADPGSLDPHKATGDWEDRIISELFEGLVTEGPDATAIPGQAEAWAISDDQLVYTFTLRPDARWDDGRPVVAQDFVDGFQRLFDPRTASEYAYLQFHIRNASAIAAGDLTPDALGVTALDEQTLEIKLEAPTPYFIESLTHYTALPIRKDLIEQWGDDWTQPGHLVGNGPYRLIEWVPGSHLRGIKSTSFHDSADVAIEEINWINSADLSAALHRYRAGEIDWLTEFPADQYGFLQERHPGEAHIQPYLGIYYFELNQQKPPFDDIRVRRALSISVVREVLGPDVLGTGELPAYGWVPPGVANYDGPAYHPDWADQSIDKRRQEARELLAAAGYGPSNPLKLRLRFFTNDNTAGIMVAVQSMWSEVGVEVELYGSEVAAHFDALAAGDFEVGMAGWLLDYNDASNVLDLLRSPPQGLDGIENWGNNHGRFNNSAYDALLTEAAQTVDLGARGRLLHEAEALAMDAFASIPLYWPVGKNLVSPEIAGFVDNVEDIHRVRWMSKSE